MSARLTPRIAALLTLPPMLWAGNAVVGRLMVGTIPPLALNALRWSLAFVILLPLGWRALRRPREIAQRWKYLSLLALTGVGSYNALQYLAVQTSTPLNVTLIAASSPLWMLLVGATLFRAPPNRHQVAGAVLSLAGVALVISRGSLSTLLQVQLLAGDLYMLGATALWAGYSWMLARPPASLTGERRPSWNWAEYLLVQIGFGAVWACAGAGAEAWVDPQPIHASAGLFAALAYVAIGPSVLAYRFWGLGVATVGPAVSAFFANLTPLFAAVLSSAVLGEVPHWYHGAAFVLIAAGIAASARR